MKAERERERSVLRSSSAALSPNLFFPSHLLHYSPKKPRCSAHKRISPQSALQHGSPSGQVAPRNRRAPLDQLQCGWANGRRAEGQASHTGLFFNLIVQEEEDDRNAGAVRRTETSPGSKPRSLQHAGNRTDTHCSFVIITYTVAFRQLQQC